MARSQDVTRSSSSSSAEKVGRVKQVSDLLRAEDKVSLPGSLGTFLRGLGLCLVIGVVVAAVLHFGLIQVTGRDPLGWWAWFGVFWAILIVGLAMTSRTKNPGYVVASLDANIPDPADGAGGSKLPTFLNPVLAGPRRLRDGLAGVRGKWTPRQNAGFKRTAQMVLEMARYDGGVEIRSLMHPPEDMALFNGAVDWLDKHDWVGKSSDGQRMWITSIGRKKLTTGGVQYKMDKM